VFLLVLAAIAKEESGLPLRYRRMARVATWYPLGKMTQRFPQVPEVIRFHLADLWCVVYFSLIVAVIAVIYRSKNHQKIGIVAAWLAFTYAGLGELLQIMARQGDVVDMICYYISFGVAIHFLVTRRFDTASTVPAPTKKGPACRKPSHRSSRRPRH